MRKAKFIYAELKLLEDDLDRTLKLIDPAKDDLRLLNSVAKLKKKLGQIKVQMLSHIQDLEKLDLEAQ